MKPRLLYGLIFTIYGFLAGFAAALGLTGATLGLLWIFVYGDNLWPGWVNVFMPAFFLGVFLLVFIVTFMFGLRYAMRQATTKEPAAVKKDLQRHLLIAGILLIAFSLYQYSRARKAEELHLQAQRKEETINSLEQIISMDVSQSGEGFEVKAAVSGPSADTYKLTVGISSNGYVKAGLLEFVQEVPLSFELQEFTFPVPFEQLETVYRKELLKYIPSFERPFGIDEYIGVDVSLELVKSDRYPGAELEKLAYPVQERSAALRFFFSCYQDHCDIIQKEKEDGTEQTTDTVPNNN